MLSALATHWILLLAAGLLSFFLTGAFTWYAKRLGMFDIPGDRHSHSHPTPRGGGAGLVLSLLLAGWLALPEPGGSASWPGGILPGAVILGIMGWWDDRVSLSPLIRFLVQLAVSCYFVWCVNAVYPPGNVLLLVIAWLFLNWMINLYNFMDGSNGMAGAQGVFAGCILAALFFMGGDEAAGLLSALLAMVCIGFLPWNLGKARVFMGDVASGTLGYVIGALLVYGVFSGGIAMAVAWMVMLVFLCDGTMTLLVRVLKGERWYNPHKQHIYQRLISSGWSHGRVLTLYQLVNLVLVVPAIAVAVNFPASATVIAFTITAVLGLGWLLVRHKLGVLAQAG